MLLVLKKGGVNRISINPQSMQAETLKTIGRAHTPQDVIDKVTMARRLGFKNINMDIIIGLPGETVDDVMKTMDALTIIQPENLTVHTMAIKRASKLNETREDFELPIDYEVTKMLALSESGSKKMGMHPYYLYRQKQILGQLENVGYAKVGHDCLYNIQMMEERQTILGLGVGSGSKFVNSRDWTLESMYNPKDPQNYLERIEELIKRKKDKLGMILNSY
jgi:oxygen-independent coproporphyrinogen III oxidase